MIRIRFGGIVCYNYIATVSIYENLSANVYS